MKNFKKGFTLVEMLIVVVIIGILAAALLPRMQSAQAQARDVARVASVQQIINAVAAYKEEYGKYPVANETPAIGSVATLLTKLKEVGIVNTLPEESQSSRKSLDGQDGKYAYYYAEKGPNDTAKAMAIFAGIERPAKANVALDNIMKASITNGNSNLNGKKIEDIRGAICSSTIEVDKNYDPIQNNPCKTASDANLRFVAIY